MSKLCFCEGPVRKGFTLAQLACVMLIIGLMAVVLCEAISTVREPPLMVRCVQNLRQLYVACQAYWQECGRKYPDAISALAGSRAGVSAIVRCPKTGRLYEIVRGDENKGHGNDADGYDEQNPGKSAGCRRCKSRQPFPDGSIRIRCPGGHLAGHFAELELTKGSGCVEWHTGTND